jgi:hypothetical protein
MKRLLLLAPLIIYSASSTADDTVAKSTHHAETASNDLSNAEKSVIAKVIAGKLKDPDSAKFRWGPAHRVSGGVISYCGMVNGKNSYGGYVGFVPFYVDGVTHADRRIYLVVPPLAKVGGGSEDSVESEVVKRLCEKNGYDAKYFQQIEWAAGGR